MPYELQIQPHNSTLYLPGPQDETRSTCCSLSGKIQILYKPSILSNIYRSTFGSSNTNGSSNSKKFTAVSLILKFEGVSEYIESFEDPNASICVRSVFIEKELIPTAQYLDTSNQRISEKPVGSFTVGNCWEIDFDIAVPAHLPNSMVVQSASNSYNLSATLILLVDNNSTVTSKRSSLNLNVADLSLEDDSVTTKSKFGSTHSKRSSRSSIPIQKSVHSATCSIQVVRYRRPLPKIDSLLDKPPQCSHEDISNSLTTLKTIFVLQNQPQKKVCCLLQFPKFLSTTSEFLDFTLKIFCKKSSFDSAFTTDHITLHSVASSVHQQINYDPDCIDYTDSYPIPSVEHQPPELPIEELLFATLPISSRNISPHRGAREECRNMAKDELIPKQEYAIKESDGSMGVNLKSRTCSIKEKYQLPAAKDLGKISGTPDRQMLPSSKSPYFEVSYILSIQLDISYGSNSIITERGVYSFAAKITVADVLPSSFFGPPCCSSSSCFKLAQQKEESTALIAVQGGSNYFNPPPYLTLLNNYFEDAEPLPRYEHQAADLCV